jgi:hypothetical protein
MSSSPVSPSAVTCGLEVIELHLQMGGQLLSAAMSLNELECPEVRDELEQLASRLMQARQSVRLLCAEVSLLEVEQLTVDIEQASRTVPVGASLLVGAFTMVSLAGGEGASEVLMRLHQTERELTAAAVLEPRLRLLFDDASRALQAGDLGAAWRLLGDIKLQSSDAMVVSVAQAARERLLSPLL